MTPEADLLVRKHQRMCIQAPAMFSIIESLEWIHSDSDLWPGYYCPDCGHESEDGHNENCVLNAILKAVRGEDA